MLNLGYPYFIIALIALTILCILVLLYILIPYIILVLDKEVSDDYFDNDEDRNMKELH